jgi:formylglycine-generating enzyme required for sulfatase activity
MNIEPEIFIVPAGPVVLGAPAFPADSKLPHPWKRVEINLPRFGVAKFAVTVGEYLRFAETSNYAISDELPADKRFSDPRAPAAFVSWIDATRYVQWLARLTGKPYRLLRDAEYEKAARGGLVGKKFPWGDADPHGHADCANPDGSPKPVGSFAPNAYGLYDMAGSMWSWCEECYEQVVREDRAKMCYDDARKHEMPRNAICRGGSFKTADPMAMYCAYRHEDPTDSRFDCIGFRVGLTIAS